MGKKTTTLPMKKVQELANDFMKESQIKEFTVTHTDGQAILVIHLLTDFYKFIESSKN